MLAVYKCLYYYYYIYIKRYQIYTDFEVKFCNPECSKIRLQATAMKNFEEKIWGSRKPQLQGVEAILVAPRPSSIGAPNALVRHCNDQWATRAAVS